MLDGNANDRPARESGPNMALSRPAPSLPTRRAHRGFRRLLLVEVALALMIGIAVDRSRPTEPLIWIAVGMSSLGGFLLVRRIGSSRFGVGDGFLWLAVLAVGACSHHRRTNIFASDDIGSFASATPSLCRVRGTLSAEPIARHKESGVMSLSWRRPEATDLTLIVSAILDGANWRPASGRLMGRIDGPPLRLERGDSVEIVGWLSAPHGPRNEGEFDFARYLRDRRVRAWLSCADPGAVAVLPTPRSWSLARPRDRWRRSAGRWLRNSLPPERAGLAEAILLGKRTTLTRAELVPFLRSGTMHLLVVSGLHVGLLAIVLSGSCALFGLKLRSRALCVMVLVAGYAFLTGGAPPVIRATIVIGIFLSGFLFERPAHPINSLAAAALVVLALDPTDLFRAGPQLSFLAVLAICLYIGMLRNARAEADDSTADDQGPIRSTLAWGTRLTYDAVILSAVIWVVTAPLIAYRFHLFTPIGVILSPLLLIPLWLGFVFGIGFLLVHVIAPSLADWLSYPLDAMLWAIEWGVDTADRVPFGFAHIRGFPGWWVLGLYLLLVVPWPLIGIPMIRRAYLGFNLAWLGVGVALSLPARPPATLEYYQLAVGHGSCALLRFPSGENVIYDVGSMGGPEVVERIVAPFLWSKGIPALDAVFLSHSDVDHCNGLIELARRFPIRGVYFAPQFVHADLPPIRYLDRESVRLSVPSRMVWTPDRFELGDGAIEVVHPAADFSGARPNASSLTLRCRWRDRTILLTGDLESEGLADAMTRPVGPIDLLTAPHHGSRSSNTAAVARWADPRIVVCSRGHQRRAESPLAVYADRGALVLSTDVDGAVSCRFETDGIEVTTVGSRRTIRTP